MMPGKAFEEPTKLVQKLKDYLLKLRVVLNIFAIRLNFVDFVMI